VVVALTTAQKLGIAGIAAAFILFALISSFVAPLRDRNFPGRRGLPYFVALTAALFAAMMFAIVALAREEEEAEAHAEEPAAAETGPAAEARGDAEAGKAVFASAGCGGCHVLEAAGSSGEIGPNLDATSLDYEAIVEQVTNGGGGMPPFGAQLSEEQIRDVAAFVFEAAQAS
jgi:mono/diheme cytochrome c family protein